MDYTLQSFFAWFYKFTLIQAFSVQRKLLVIYPPHNLA